MTDTELVLEDYSEKAIVVRGDTKTHKDALVKLGGKWNAGLRGGGGWIFPKKKEADVSEYVLTGKMTKPETAPKEPREPKQTSPPDNSDITREIAKLSKKVRQMNDLLQKLAEHLLPKDDTQEDVGDVEETEKVSEEEKIEKKSRHKRLLK